LLKSKEWLLKLAFLTDVSLKLNELNTELQGKARSISDMISSVNSCKMKLKLWMVKLGKKNTTHFLHLKDEIAGQEQFYNFTGHIKILTEILDQFQRRFAEFNDLHTICGFLSSPLNLNINDVQNLAQTISKTFPVDMDNLEMQLVELQNDVALMQLKASDLWKFLNPEKYSCLREVYLRISSFFGSTYLCESSFSHMNLIKSKYRTRLDDARLDDCLRFATSGYKPNFCQIASDTQCQISH